MRQLRPKSVRELTADHLRESIINGTVKMGQALSERRIAQQLAISKPQVHEALALLQAEGLVVIQPQKRPRVFSLSNEDINQLCDFRLFIEFSAIKLAIVRNANGLGHDMNQIVSQMKIAKLAGDIESYLILAGKFYQLIFKYSDNNYLISSYSNYAAKIAVVRKWITTRNQQTELSVKDHGSLALAVLNRNEAEIERLLKVNINQLRQVFAESSLPDEAITCEAV